jgi:Phosphate-selective porin O and P
MSRSLRSFCSGFSVVLFLVAANQSPGQLGDQGSEWRPTGSAVPQQISDPLPTIPASEQAPSDGTTTQDQKAIEKLVADALKKKEEEKKKADEIKAEEKKAEDRAKKAEDLFGGTQYNLQTLFDSLHRPNLDASEKKWYEKLSIRGYTQFRFDRTLRQDLEGGQPNMFGDRSINGDAENFSIRRARLILFGDVSDHFYLYFQPDFGSTPQGSTTSTFFAQLRDLYADIYVDTTKIHRFRVGLSKVPFGWENMQSIQNRVPLDRADAMNTAVSPNERDLGIFYYWTPPDQQKLFKVLVDSGLKGSGNYGVFGLGVYDGQGGSVPEANLNLHTVARFTYPYQLNSGQVVEASIQGFTGEYTVSGAEIRPLGIGDAKTPAGTGRGTEILDQRAAVSFIWYPQPFGFQAEWEVGRGPGLNDEQTEVVDRSLYGGYVLAMYRCETECYGIITPYCRYQQYKGGYRSFANAPYGNHREVDLGIEWQMRKEMELVMEYSILNVPNFAASSTSQSYRDFDGNVLRFQFQVNY